MPPKHIDITHFNEAHKQKILSIRQQRQIQPHALPEKPKKAVQISQKKLSIQPISEQKQKIENIKQKIRELNRPQVQIPIAQSVTVGTVPIDFLAMAENETELLSSFDPKIYGDLSILKQIDRKPGDLYISLATIPPRLVSDEFEKVINSLFSQKIIPKNVIVNVCSTYKRSFDTNPAVIQSKMKALKAKYSELIFNISEDYGPITKILGLMHLQDFKFHDNDIIIVVDDDWEMKSTMTFYYKYLYQLYGCDCVFVNEHEVIDQPNGKFMDNKILFYDNYCSFVYGWLGFSFKYKYIARLFIFYSTHVSVDEWLWKHDDLLLTLFYKYSRLYACGINMYFNNSFVNARLTIEENNALRGEPGTYDKRITLEKKMLDKFGYGYYMRNGQLRLSNQNCAKYIIPESCNQRDYLYNAHNVSYDPNTNDFYNKQIDFKFLDKNVLVATVTWFNTSNKAMIDYKIGQNVLHFIPNRNTFSRKSSYFLKTDTTLNYVIQKPKPYKIVQTAEKADVSCNNFYSVMTMLSYLPDIEYVFFDSFSRRKYIETNAMQYLEHYDKLIPGAYRADLFRAIYLYLHGGVYCDCKNILYHEISLLDTVPEIFCKDIGAGYVCNGFIFTKNAANITIKKYLDEMATNISNGVYGENSLCITGPKVLGNYAVDNLHFENNVIAGDWKNSYITHKKNIIIKNSYTGYYDENDYANKGHYNVLWKEKRVYN